MFIFTDDKSYIDTKYQIVFTTVPIILIIIIKSVQQMVIMVEKIMIIISAILRAELI